MLVGFGQLWRIFDPQNEKNCPNFGCDFGCDFGSPRQNVRDLRRGELRERTGSCQRHGHRIIDANASQNAGGHSRVVTCGLSRQLLGNPSRHAHDGLAGWARAGWSEMTGSISACHGVAIESATPPKLRGHTEGWPLHPIFHFCTMAACIKA